MIDNFQDFIYYNDDALPQQTCEELVDFYANNRDRVEHMREKCMDFGAVVPSNPQTRDDYVYFINIEYNERHHIDQINNAIHDAIVAYTKKYRFMWESNRISWQCLKYHIVKKMGGYHTWHHEWNVDFSRWRVAVWHISLTTHEDEGELEFLHQGHRINPKAGRILVWPAGVIL